jgi:uncharacterized membrane protein
MKIRLSLNKYSKKLLTSISRKYFFHSIFTIISMVGSTVSLRILSIWDITEADALYGEAYNASF